MTIHQQSKSFIRGLIKSGIQLGKNMSIRHLVNGLKNIIDLLIFYLEVNTVKLVLL